MRNRFHLVALGLAILASSRLCAAQEPPKAPQEKVPGVIPAPRAEPVVPPSPAKSIATQLNDAYVNVFERVAPAVVVIDVTKKATADAEGSDVFPDFFHGGPGGDAEAPGVRHSPRGPLSEGSGFIIQAGGYILTNNHVVTGASEIKVRLKDGRVFAARLTGTDEKTDIAVVKIDAADLPVEELADSDAVRVGEIACAIGVPYNEDFSFTTGVVSAKGRHLGMISEGYEDYLQTDASINPGNSGGPLVDLDGKVIGMNTLINGLNHGLGFAIPSNMLREVGDQLIHAGHVVRPYIGVRVETLEDVTEKYGLIFGGVKKGVVVDMIMADSPAYHSSELHALDVITEVDGVPVHTDHELQKQILGKRIGAQVQLTVYRKGKTMKLPITTSELPAIATRGDLPGNDESEGEAVRQESGRLFGMQLQELTREWAANLGVSATHRGCRDQCGGRQRGVPRGNRGQGRDYGGGGSTGQGCGIVQGSGEGCRPEARDRLLRRAIRGQDVQGDPGRVTGPAGGEGGLALI